MMETRYGLTGTVLNEIFFSESSHPNVQIIKHLSVEISRQNSNLRQVKEKLVVEAKSVGANAIINFRYGQKAHKPWELLAFKWDTESWHGEGDAVKL
jgi:hypothetical protein